MILQNQVMGYFEKFLTRHFKDYMEKKRKPAKWFKYLIPEELRKKTRTKVSNMFEYNYDMQWNTMTLHLKTIYIMALLFAIGSITYHASKTKVQGSQQMKFAKNVRANIPKFNLRKFEKFVRTRNI